MLESKDKHKLLKHALFAETSPDLIEHVISKQGGGIQSFSDGELLHSPDTNAEPRLGILLSGKATVSTPSEGHAVLLRFLGAGDLFGIANLFSEEQFVSVIRANGSCQCAFFSEAAIGELLAVDKGFRERYIGFLTGRIRFLNRKIGYLTAGSAERRLALYLSSLGEGEVHLEDSITSLSDLLNLGRASLYRAFDRLCHDGHLIKNGRDLVIVDATALKNAYK